MAGAMSSFGLNTLKLPTPEKFTGGSEDWENFTFVMKAYMSTFDARFGYLMTTAETETLAITDMKLDTFDSNLATAPTVPSTALARQLYFVLISVAASTLPTLRSITDNNGVEAWRLLHLRYSLNKTSTNFASLTKIMNFDFKEDQFEQDFQLWENLVAKYETESGTTLEESLKIAVMLNKTSGKLQEHLRLNAGLLKTYQSIRTCVVDYYKTAQTFKDLKAAANPKQGDGINFVGKGKGRGKGTWKGNNFQNQNFQQNKGGKGNTWKGGNGKGFFNNVQNNFQTKWNFKGQGKKGKGKGKTSNPKGKGKGKGTSYKGQFTFKGKGKGRNNFKSNTSKKWCRNCSSSTHWTSHCWHMDTNAIQNLYEDYTYGYEDEDGTWINTFVEPETIAHLSSDELYFYEDDLGEVWAMTSEQHVEYVAAFGLEQEPEDENTVGHFGWVCGFHVEMRDLVDHYEPQTEELAQSELEDFIYMNLVAIRKSRRLTSLAGLIHDTKAAVSLSRKGQFPPHTAEQLADQKMSLILDKIMERLKTSPLTSVASSSNEPRKLTRLHDESTLAQVTDAEARSVLFE